VRSKPAHLDGRHAAIRRYGSDLKKTKLAAVMADFGVRGRVTYRDKSLDNMQVQGVPRRKYINFSSSTRAAAPYILPRRERPALHVIGWQADRLFWRRRIQSTMWIQIEGVHFRVLGVTPARLAARPYAGLVRDHPAAQFPHDVRLTAIAVDRVRPRDLSHSVRLSTRRRSRCAPRDGSLEAFGQFGVFTSDTIRDIYHSATTASSRARSSRCAVAGVGAS